jgi:succinoglycan biosynthesis protein ExoM
MFETYYLTVCSLGENPNLAECLRNLLEIKEITNENVEVLLVVNQEKVNQTFNSRVLVYFEPRMGYSNVRNKAISVLPENAHLIFLDDDEIPNLSWFEALVKANKKYNSDVIFGPVYPLHAGSDKSYRSMASQKYKNLVDESEVDQAPTANMLIPSNLLNKKLIHFDPIFNKSGSEDTDLCFRLRNQGVKIRFAKDAIIYENEKEQRFHVNYLESRRKKEIANYSLVIRRNSTYRKIFWRFNTLIIRIVFYGLIALFNSRYKVERDAYFYSLKVLLSGIPREF